tara:strand:- start:172 stop:558 length:387 start_codon:yes stop_codon:yes gene_type:complete
MYLLILATIILLFLYVIIKYTNNKEINKYIEKEKSEDIKENNLENLDNKKFNYNNKNYFKCLKFDKHLINMINNILKNNKLKTKNIAEELNKQFNIKISKEELNKGVLKWMNRHKLVKYDKVEYKYYK